ncbi:MAG: type VI secretion system tube protein Hcp [Desulfatitalea sp.]
MAFDGFIKIGEIQGESSDAKHTGWIEILDCNMGILQNISTTNSSCGGATAERADFSDFRFTKLLDKSTPELALACAQGKSFDTITIELCRAGTEKIKFMEFKFTNCIIRSIRLNAAGDFPAETIAIHYGKVQWCYTQQSRAGGQACGNVATGWNREKNCAV